MTYGIQFNLIKNLRARWALVNSDLDRYLEEIFQDLPLDSDDDINRNQIKSAIERMEARYESSLKFKMAYPRSLAEIPCISVALAMETTADQFLGDDYEPEEVTPTGWKYTFGEMFDKTFRVGCYTTNGDLTVFIYEIMKWAIISSKNNILPNVPCISNSMLIKLQGSDLEPAPDYIPSEVYQRALLVKIDKVPEIYFTKDDSGVPTEIAVDTHFDRTEGDKDAWLEDPND